MSKESLRQSEERFRLLVEGVREYAIFMLDREGHVATWNEGAKRTKGYRTEEIVSKHFSLFYTQEDVEHGHPEKELRVAAEEGRYEEEGVRVRRDGSRFWASVLVTALRDEEGELRGFSKVVRDITQRKEAEKRLQNTLDRLLALYETGQIFGSSLRREEIGSKLLEIMRRVSGIRAAAISLPDGNGPLKAWRTSDPEEVLDSVSGDPEVETARRDVLETGKPRSFELRLQEQEVSISLTGVLLPLRIRNHTIGVMEAYGLEELGEEESVETLASLASQAASALENARLYEELSEREEQLEGLVGKLITAQSSSSPLKRRSGAASHMRSMMASPR